MKSLSVRVSWDKNSQKPSDVGGGGDGHKITSGNFTTNRGAGGRDWSRRAEKNKVGTENSQEWGGERVEGKLR